MPWTRPTRLPRAQLLSTILLILGSAALAWLDPLTSLCCLPLLLGGLALGRGRTWSVFLLLGGATAALTLVGQGLIHEAVYVPAGAALLAVALVVPALWRFDAPAFSLAAACMTGLGVGAALGLVQPPVPQLLQLPETTTETATETASTAPPFAGQRIDPTRFAVRLSRLPRPGLVQLQITNHSGRPVTFVEPLDGSEWGWLQPTYTVVGYTRQGQRLPMHPRCSNHGGVYDLRTMHLLRHGETFTTALRIPWFWLENGVARVHALYRFDPARVSGTLAEWSGTPEVRRRLARLFVGELASPEIALRSGARVAPGPPEVMGSLDKEIIRRVTNHNLHTTQHCFDNEQPTSVRVRYIIGAHGRVVMVKVEQAPKEPWYLRGCLERAIKTWRFPQCKCGGIVIVSQPFETRVAWE